MVIRVWRSFWNRVLQWLAEVAPGERSLRPWLHRRRGVKMGKNCGVARSALLETNHPNLISIGDNVYIGVRATVVGHFRQDPPPAERRRKDLVTVRIGDRVFIGAGALILPNVTIGEGSVVTAGSVVTRSVPPHTLVQGNPAEPIARCGIDLGLRPPGEADTPLREFYKKLKPL